MSATAQDTTAHPDAVLYPDSGRPLPQLAAVEHFAGNERLMRKAMALQAERGALFDITLDCEDGAAPGAEREHAALVADLIMSDANRFGRIGARIHDLTHDAWRSDLDQIVGGCGERLAYLSLPKARGVSDVERLIACLREAEGRAGLRREVPLHVIIETHGALHQVWEIAALPGVETLDFGIMDFVSAHHGALGAETMRSPLQFEHPLLVRAKAEVANAALAHGVVPSHNVCTELNAPETVRDDARRARSEFAYLRMWSIHPAQIDPILLGMQPAENEIGVACAILCAAQDAGWSPIRHANRLHDRGSFRHYWSTLKRARATGAALPEEALNRFFT